jgi:hypothetical protein
MKIPVHSITTKLLLLFFSVGLASMALVGLYSFYSARQAIVQRTMDQLISVRAVKKQQIEFFFAEKIRNLEFLARSNDMKLLAEETFHSDLYGKRRSMEGIQADGDLKSKEKRKSLAEARENILSYYRDYGFSNLYLIAEGKEGRNIMALDTIVTLPLADGLSKRLMVIRNDFRPVDSIKIYDLFKRWDNDTLPVCLMCGRITDDSGRRNCLAVLEIRRDQPDHAAE